MPQLIITNNRFRGMRPGMGDVPVGFYTGYATGICEGGFDTGDGSPCTTAIPGAQGGISQQELDAYNASLNAGVAPITWEDIVTAGQEDAATVMNTPLPYSPVPTYTPSATYIPQPQTVVPPPNALNTVTPQSSPITQAATTNVLSAPSSAYPISTPVVNQGIVPGVSVGANTDTTTTTDNSSTYLLLAAAALGVFLLMGKR